MAEGGGDRTRQVKLDRARELIGHGVREATEAMQGAALLGAAALEFCLFPTSGINLTRALLGLWLTLAVLGTLL